MFVAFLALVTNVYQGQRVDFFPFTIWKPYETTARLRKLLTEASTTSDGGFQNRWIKPSKSLIRRTLRSFTLYSYFLTRGSKFTRQCPANGVFCMGPPFCET